MVGSGWYLVPGSDTDSIQTSKYSPPSGETTGSSSPQGVDEGFGRAYLSRRSRMCRRAALVRQALMPKGR